MVVTGTSSVTTFGTQTFRQTVRVDITEVPQPPSVEPAEPPPQPQPEDTGAAQPQPEATGAAHPQPDEATGVPHPQPADEPQPEDEPHPEEATPQPLTGTSSVTVWYEPMSLVTVRLLCTGYVRQT